MELNNTSAVVTGGASDSVRRRRANLVRAA